MGENMKSKDKLIEDYKAIIKEFIETEALLKPGPFGGYFIGLLGGGYESTPENLQKVEKLGGQAEQLLDTLELSEEELEKINEWIEEQDWYIKIQLFKSSERKKMLKIMPGVMEWTNKITGDKTFSEEQIEHAENVKEVVEGVEKIVDEEMKKDFIARRDAKI